MNKKEKIKKHYAELREETFYHFYIINKDNLKKHEEELINLHEYLPKLISNLVFLPYTLLNELGLWDEILKKSSETKHYSNEEKYYELLKWIDAHKEFEDILNKKEIKKLEKELQELEKYEKQTLDIIS